MSENNNETTKKVSVSERTHAKNVENLHIARTIMASAGALYNPTNPLLDLTSLADFEDGFSNRMQTVNEKEAAEKNAVGIQIAAFKTVNKRIALMMKAAKGQSLKPEYIERLQATANRLYGVKVGKKTPDENPEGGTPKAHSTSQHSYAGILENLDEFDEQLKSNPEFAPNETEYKTATFSAWLQEMRGIHNAALEAKIATRTTRSDRNQFGYNKTDGLLARMNPLKAYAELIFNKEDPRFKQLKKLKFEDLSR